MNRAQAVAVIRNKLLEIGFTLVTFNNYEAAMIFKKNESDGVCEKDATGVIIFQEEKIICYASRNHFGEMMILFSSLEMDCEVTVSVSEDNSKIIK